MQMFYEDEQVSMFAPDSCAGGVRQYLHGKHEKRCGRGPAAGDHGNHAGRHPDRKASGPPLI